MGPAPDRQAASGEPPPDVAFGFGPFEFDPVASLLYRGNEEVLLPPRAAALLEVFLRRPGEVLSKSELLDAVWKDAFVGEDSLTQALSVIRHALDDDPRSPTYIETKWKRGYRFVAEVTSLARGRPSPDARETSPPRPSRPGPDGATPADGQVQIDGRLGHYEILGDLGAGAMGVVYRARDTILERDVAIKVLPRAFVANPSRVALLQHEARLLASLSHPNISSIFSLEQIDGVTFPVLELVEGPTLEDRIQAGGMTLKESLEVCRQVAAGLGAAHERGVVHRDLKPANIKVTPDGQAKVLDFGLATSVSVRRDEEVGADAPSPGVGLTGSYRGAIIGTVAYMSPEQARGQDADARSDIWSFGCVLYETLTGRQAFRRDTVAATLRAIAEEPPDWAMLPPPTPPLIRSLVRRCLRQEPDRRLQDIADARLEIEEALEELAGAVPQGPDGVARSAFRLMVPWGLAGLAALVALWSFTRGALSTPPPPPVVQLLAEVEPGLRLTGGHPQESWNWGFQRPSRGAVALSPDGTELVYAASDGAVSRLYLRDMGRHGATPIQGTDGGHSPFFSPDGQWIGFYADGALKKVPHQGGEPRTLVATAPPPFGASWAEDDLIVMAAGERGGLLAVSANGGVPHVLTEVDPENGDSSHRLPHVLPGGRAVVYTVVRGLYSEHASVVVESLATRERKVLVTEATDGRFVPTGHLVFARQGTLMAAPFSLERLEVTGEAVRVVEDVMQATEASSTMLDSGAAQYSFSTTGALVYVPGGSYPPLSRSLVWVDRDGTAEALPLPEGGYSAPRVSPDGQQVAYTAGPRAHRDLWVYDLTRGTLRRLTFGASNGGPVWSPDGTRLAFPADRGDGVLNLFAIAVDGSGAPVPLTQSDQSEFVSSWSSNGTLAFVRGPGSILTLSMTHSADPVPVFDSTFNTLWPAFSPDGAWLAYTSDETGQDEVWVRSYAGSSPPIRISTSGGTSPAWSRDGTELFFRNAGTMMATSVSTGRSFTNGRPRALFDDSGYAVASPTRAYDVAPDGRFLMVTLSHQEPQPATRIRVVINWFDDLKQRVPLVLTPDTTATPSGRATSRHRPTPSAARASSPDRTVRPWLWPFSVSWRAACCSLPGWSSRF